MKKLIAFLAVLACFYIIGINIQKIPWLPFGNKGAQAESVQNIHLIAVDVAAADTKIVPQNRDDVEAEYKGKGKLKVSQSGETLNITLKRDLFQGFTFWDKKKLTIYVPDNYNQNMSFKIGSGLLHFSGPSQNKPMELNNLNIDMSSGVVQLENLHAQSYRHEGSSGNAQLDWVAAKEGSVKMSSGNVEMRHYNGALDARLSSGRLKVQFDQLNHPVNVKISSGIVKLDLPKNSDFTLKGKASSGIISCDFPLKSNSDSRHKIDGTYGSGDNKVNVEVSSGTVDIY